MNVVAPADVIQLWLVSDESPETVNTVGVPTKPWVTEADVDPLEILTTPEDWNLFPRQISLAPRLTPEPALNQLKSSKTVPSDHPTSSLMRWPLGARNRFL